MTNNVCGLCRQVLVRTGLLADGAQDNLQFWNGKVTLVAGIREDRQVATTYNYYAHTAIYDDVREGTTHKYGIVVRPIEPLTLFYNYSQTFQPNGFATDVNGSTYKLPNLDSAIAEEGAKISLFRDRLLLTASYFKTAVADATVLMTEFNSQGQGVGVQVPAGRQVIQGWETDGTFAVTQDLSVLGGAGNLDSKTATGLLARGVPFGTNYRGFAKYEFHTGYLAGLFFGLGVQHNGPRAADSADDATLAPYTIANGLIGYEYGRQRRWRLQVNINNLTNEVYAAVAVSRSIIYAGMPRDAAATLSYSF